MQDTDAPPPLPRRRRRSEEDVEETFGNPHILNTEGRAFEDPNDTPPPLPKHGVAIEQQDFVGHLQNIRLDMALVTSAEGSTFNNTMIVQSPESVDETLPITPGSIQEKPAWKKGLEEARHFAGGLVSHPYESTKHFSILRHSHGLVWYQGPTTNVAITIFSDEHLPPDRTIWLQKKGWLGKTGWAARAMLGAKGDWVNVTPENVGAADTISPTDERAWQRDIKNFLKKAPKELARHVPRETNVLRIPDTDLGDGYFRLVLCQGGDGKKMLCSSPVFRVASLSTSGASFKGSSLSTLPMELGVFAATSIATAKVSAITAPVTNAISSYTQQYVPSFTTQEAATTAYGVSGVPNRIDNANEQFAQTRSNMFEPVADEVGVQRAFSEETKGPVPPYPLQLESKIVKGIGKSGTELGLPTANLRSLPEDIETRLEGVYFGWARIRRKAAEKKDPEKTYPVEKVDPVEAAATWKESIITIGPSPYAAPTAAPKKVGSVYLIHDLSGADFTGANIIVLIMGFLRPKNNTWPPPVEQAYEDVATTQLALSAPGWGVQDALDRLSGGKKNITDRYVSAREFSQKQIDRVPLHRAGIRTETAAMRDRAFKRGGVCIPR